MRKLLVAVSIAALFSVPAIAQVSNERSATTTRHVIQKRTDVPVRPLTSRSALQSYDMLVDPAVATDGVFSPPWHGNASIQGQGN
jgi:hypothetical protein